MKQSPSTRYASVGLQRNGRQRGGFAIGLIVGLLIGLALALGVALYVTKVPVPFVNKVPQRTSSQDAAEAEKNKNWDPNAPLATKPLPKPGSASGVPGTPPVATAPATTSPTAPATGLSTVPAPPAGRDPAAILNDRGTPPVAAASRPATAASSGTVVSTAPSADPFNYFVQAGAFGRTEDAEQQRAKLAMMGLESRLSEREQSGRTVYRVRVGPYERRAEAESAKDKLAESGIEAQLVRVQR